MSACPYPAAASDSTPPAYKFLTNLVDGTYISGDKVGGSLRPHLSDVELPSPRECMSMHHEGQSRSISIRVLSSMPLMQGGAVCRNDSGRSLPRARGGSGGGGGGCGPAAERGREVSRRRANTRADGWQGLPLVHFSAQPDTRVVENNVSTDVQSAMQRELDVRVSSLC